MRSRIEYVFFTSAATLSHRTERRNDMGSSYIAYMKVTDKHGREFIYALHENKSTEEELAQLTEDELKLFKDEKFHWN